MKNGKIIKLLMSMINALKSFDEKIGFTKKELDHLIDKYDLYNLDYSPKDAIELYEEKYLTKEQFIDKIREFFEEAENGDLEDMDVIDYIGFLEKNSLLDICMDYFKYSDIKKDDDGTWYFYAKDGWKYFSDYFKVSSNYINNVVEMILSGDSYELFDRDFYDGDLSYLDISDENLKWLIQILQNMKDDFEIEQDEIDDVSNVNNVYDIANEYDLDDLKTGLEISYCDAQRFADENEAYESTTNQVLEHFGLTLDGLKWVKADKDSEYAETLKIKFKSESDAEEAMILLYKIENEPWGDTDDYKIDYSSPYNGWHGDADKYIDEEIQERVCEYVDEKYIP